MRTTSGGGRSTPAGPAQVAGEHAAAERRLDPLRGRVEKRVGLGHRRDRALGGGAVRGRVEHPHELAEVQAHRGVQVGLAGAPPPPGGLGVGGELEVLLGDRGPRVEPVLPPLDPRRWSGRSRCSRRPS